MTKSSVRHLVIAKRVRVGSSELVCNQLSLVTDDQLGAISVSWTSNVLTGTLATSWLDQIALRDASDQPFITWNLYGRWGMGLTLRRFTLHGSQARDRLTRCIVDGSATGQQF